MLKTIKFHKISKHNTSTFYRLFRVSICLHLTSNFKQYVRHKEYTYRIIKIDDFYAHSLDQIPAFGDDFITLLLLSVATNVLFFSAERQTRSDQMIQEELAVTTHKAQQLMESISFSENQRREAGEEIHKLLTNVQLMLVKLHSYQTRVALPDKLAYAKQFKKRVRQLEKQLSKTKSTYCQESVHFETCDQSTKHSIKSENRPQKIKQPRPSTTATDPIKKEEIQPTANEYNSKSLCLLSAACMVPHIEKELKGGEDAFFVEDNIVVLADGVSQWGRQNVEVSYYSKQLTQRIGEGLKSGKSLIGAIQEAHEKTELPGSATICALKLEKGLLKVAALGDSQMKIFRDGRVIFCSEVRQHEFNMPFQLGHPNQLPQTDFVTDASFANVQVQPGDIIVSGTDGLWDNMYDKEIETILEKEPRKTAEALVMFARKNAGDPEYRGPFALALEASNKQSLLHRFSEIRGGKMDDITAVVSVVQDINSP